MRTDDINNGENMGDWSPNTGGTKKTIYTQPGGKTLMGKAPASRRLAKLQFGGSSNLQNNGSIIMGAGNSLMNQDIEGSYVKPRKPRDYNIMDYSDVNRKGPKQVDPS